MELSRKEILRYAGFRGDAAEAPAELSSRLEVLLKEAPLEPKSAWAREGDVLYLAGTVGAAFDRWQRRLAVTSAADALLAQAIGAAAVEAVMDAVEREAKASLDGGCAGPRRSPGYGDLPLSLSAEILERTRGDRIGVHATADFLLVPTKSVTAICRIK